MNNGCRPLNDNEIETILSKLKNPRDKALFTLNLYTGFRIKESLSLKVKDVWCDNQCLDRVTVFKRNMKGKSPSRTVLLHPSVKAALTEFIVNFNLDREDYLFKSKKGNNKPITRNQAWYILKRVVIGNGIKGKVALHSTRKVFAEKMYEHFGKDLIKTSKALGHRHINSTVSYLSFKTEELDSAVLSIKAFK